MTLGKKSLKAFFFSPLSPISLHWDLYAIIAKIRHLCNVLVGVEAMAATIAEKRRRSIIKQE
jgi:hypothetical protein